jgi:hypothetical protein
MISIIIVLLPTRFQCKSFIEGILMALSLNYIYNIRLNENHIDF